jgi:hypothetical protein
MKTTKKNTSGNEKGNRFSQESGYAGKVIAQDPTKPEIDPVPPGPEPGKKPSTDPDPDPTRPKTEPGKLPDPDPTKIPEKDPTQPDPQIPDPSKRPPVA